MAYVASLDSYSSRWVRRNARERSGDNSQSPRTRSINSERAISVSGESGQVVAGPWLCGEQPKIAYPKVLINAAYETRTDAWMALNCRRGLCRLADGYAKFMSNITLILVIVVAVVVIAAIVVVGYQMARRRRTERLREQYGPEYDRALDQTESQRAAESELQDRAKRHEELELRSLDSSERADFERRWTDVQGQFVDDPSTAVRNADRLVVDVMSARGYPVDDFDQRADDLSVRHAEVTQRYREARRIAQANEDGKVDTEDLRQAVTSYRALVMALLAGDGDHNQRGDVQREQDETGREQDETRRGPDETERAQDDESLREQDDTRREQHNAQMTERETQA